MSKRNTITKDRVEEILHASRFTYSTEFGKCTVVNCQLPNGFVISESSSCVDPENYDESLGYEICIRKIKERIWELEGYLLQNNLYRRTKGNVLLEEATIGELMDRGFTVSLNNLDPKDMRIVLDRRD